MSDKKPKLLIIDGNALIHRSFHALPETMMTKTGEQTNAVYGFIMVLLKSLKDIKPEYVALTLDKKGRTFRHEAFDDYKAHRVAAPMELYKQIPRIKELARAFNIPIYEMSGYEADDLIGTISRHVDGSVEKIIVTGDLDTLQLVNDHTKVYTMSHGLSDNVIYDEKKVRERFDGLGPDQMVDYKGLRGDPSDNIPGVPGIGEKTAIELLTKFKTLDGVYKYLENRRQKTDDRKPASPAGKQTTEKSEEMIKPRIAELLKTHKKQAYLSQKLARIECEAKIEFSLDETKFGRFDNEKIIKLFSELEFKSLIPRIKEIGTKDGGIAAGDESPAEDKFERNKKTFKYRLIDSEKSFQKFIIALKKQKIFSLDTETSGFDAHCSSLLGISFSWKEGEAWFIKVKNHVSKECVKSARNLNLFGSPESEDTLPPVVLGKKGIGLNKIVDALKPVLADPKIKKTGHNIKFDYKILKMSGMETTGIYFDTMIASYLLNPGSRQHGLDALTLSELGFEKISKEDLLGKGKIKIGFSEISAEKLSLYSCEDADFTFRLFMKLKKELPDRGQKKLFHEIEMPLVPILGDMELAGIKIDALFLENMGEKVKKEIAKLKEKIWQSAGLEFNINSTKQLKEILFEKLAISTLGVGKGKTGFSTSAGELFKLKDKHPIIRPLMEYRELAKLQSTYIKALPDLINGKTGRVHTSFNQSVTSTGRLSSTEPNLQNIPIRTELGREIRKAFVAEPGFKLLSADYSQIELRLAAHASGDKKMLKAFRDGLDIHSATAAEINNLALDKVTHEMRREAKAVNFGIIYGQGPRGLSESADIPYDRAREFISGYFNVYADVKKYIDESIESARVKGFAETMFGRKRYLPEINSPAIQIKKAAERMAINTPLQGAAADMIKIAMINISRMINEFNADGGESSSREENKEIRMLLQVHDELLFEVREDKIQEWAKKIKAAMEGVARLKVPIIADLKTGKNWGEMEKIEI
ncbi:MAG: DNA polymerase I [Patescibacteria group bacterium]|jgi:DNA polymerase-1